MERNKILRKDSLGGKIIAFILVIIMVGIGILSGLQAAYMLNNNIYGEDLHKDFRTKVANQYAYSIVDKVLWRGFSEYRINDTMVLGAKLVGDKDKSHDGKQLVWSYGDVKSHKEPVEEFVVENIYSELAEGKNFTRNYNVVLYLSKELESGSRFYAYDRLAEWLEKTDKAIYLIGFASVIIGAVALIYLLSAAGHKKETTEIKGSFITKIPLDIYTGLTAMAGVLTLFYGFLIINSVDRGNSSDMLYLLGLTVMYIICAFISLLWLMDVTVRIKMGKWWENTIIYRVLKSIVNSAGIIVKNLPLVWKAAWFVIGETIIEFLIITVFGLNIGGVVLVILFFEKVILFAIVMAAIIAMKKLQIAGEKISEGNLEYQVDTSNMYMDFKKHGENLNQIGQGLNAAVDEKLKSERMKTELITNVSHDIKTPLTSIINYSDLIDKELKNIDDAGDNSDNCNVEKIKEYSEVLNRQSERLKRLIEDLVEASKASTGNLDVNLEPTEVGVMLAQTAGEYDDKLSDNNLTLVVTKPEEPVYIMADGRRLWRVMDNILNNVCKYALPGTRVYMNLEKEPQEKMVIITLKNVSREPLNISPDELLERFVQGDKARKTEGNGLGLSIANSLTELQGGKLELKIDGDLFKVNLSFPEVKWGGLTT